MIQEVYSDKEDAIKAGREMFKRCLYAAVILSNGKYYVEDEPPVIRSYEKIIFEQSQLNARINFFNIKT